MTEDRYNGLVDAMREESRAPDLEPTPRPDFEPDINCGFRRADVDALVASRSAA